MFKQRTALLNRQARVSVLFSDQDEEDYSHIFYSLCKTCDQNIWLCMVWFKTSLDASPSIVTKWSLLPSQSRQLSRKMVVAFFPRGAGTSQKHFLRPLGSSLVQAFPSLQAWSGRITKPFQKGLVVVGLSIFLHCFYAGGIWALHRDFIFHSPDRATESEIPSTL